MENRIILKNLALYICAATTQILADSDELERLRQTVSRILFHQVSLPKKAYQLISDRRYHRTFNIAFGFKWNLQKLNHSYFDYYNPLILEIARKIPIKLLTWSHRNHLVFEALVILFFEDNPDQLDKIVPNVNIELLEGLYANHIVQFGIKAN